MARTEGSPAAKARRERKQLEREIAADLRQKDRDRLRLLREAIRVARAHRRASLQGVVGACRYRRNELKQKAKEIRRMARVAIQMEYDAARARCASAKKRARADASGNLSEAQQALVSERRYLKELRDAMNRKRPSRVKVRERRAESDDEVRQNLPAELVGVFDAVKSRVRPRARRTRTESFLLWAEENPEEVLRLRGDAADSDVERLVAEYQQQQRTVRSARRYSRTASAMQADAAAAAVPF